MIDDLGPICSKLRDTFEKAIFSDRISTTTDVNDRKLFNLKAGLIRVPYYQCYQDIKREQYEKS
jgi:hypothetical protein